MHRNVLAALGLCVLMLLSLTPAASAAPIKARAFDVWTTKTTTTLHTNGKKRKTVKIGYHFRVLKTSGAYYKVAGRDELVRKKHTTKRLKNLWGSKRYARTTAWRLSQKRQGFRGSRQHACLKNLWNRESGWNRYAHNRSSGAHGIPQSLPGNKMASAGRDWYHNPKTQIIWGLRYIKSRYRTPCGAWSHFLRNNWY